MIAGCGGSSEDPTPTPAVTRAVIGPAGGTLRTPSGEATIVVPAGAVAANTEFTAQALTSYPADANLVPRTAWDLRASATLEAPVRVVLSYNPADLPTGVREEGLELATLVSEAWTSVAGCSVDTEANQVAATVAHLSGWAVRARAPSGNWIYFTINGVRHRVHPDGTGFQAAPVPSRGGFRALAPDGSRMISQTANGEVYECSADGSFIRQLPFDSSTGQFFKYSPNGQKLLCFRWVSGYGGAGHLVVCNADGTDQRVIVPQDLSGIPVNAWWTNGGQVVYRYIASKDGDGHYNQIDYRRCNDDGSGVTTITPWPYGDAMNILCITPGTEILGQYYEEDPNTGNSIHWLATIVPGAPPSANKILRYDGPAEWSPVGNEFAYIQDGKLYRRQPAAAATPILVYSPTSGTVDGVGRWTP